jgi:hypothetical protein
MPLIAMVHSQNSDFRPAPAGNHIGRCYRIIDLGTQETHYEGQIRLRHKVLIGWELYIPGEGAGTSLLLAENGLPLTMSKVYTLSLNERATLRTDLQSWLGRVLSDAELGKETTAPGFDLENLLGLHGMVNVALTPREGKTWANIVGLSPLPRQFPIPEIQNTHALEFFDIRDPDEALLNRLPKKIQEKIYACQEWKAQGRFQREAHSL